MSIPTINTTHLILRAWTLEDLPALYDILQEEKILQYFPNPSAPSRDKVKGYINRQLAHWEEQGYGHWAVVEARTGRLIGWNGLEYLPEVDESEVAYLLSRNAWGLGYATEAARAALHFGFMEAGLGAIIGLVHPANAGSIRVLEKCGLAFNDRITLWGMEMSRYRLLRKDFRGSDGEMPS